MPRKGGRLTKAGYHIMRVRVVESAANTLTEKRVYLPTDVGEKVGIKIYKIIISPARPDMTLDSSQNQVRQVKVAVSTVQNCGAIPGYEGEGTLAVAIREFYNFSDGTNVINCHMMGGSHNVDFIYDFPEGIVVADKVLSIYIEGVNNSSAKEATVVIFYEPIKLSLEEFMSALTVEEYV